MTKKENYKEATDYDLNQLFGSTELVTELQAVFTKWCKNNSYTGTLARVSDLNMDDIPKEEQLATKPSITSVWDSTILMFFYKTKVKGYYVYSLTDNKSREILANDFPELYGLLIKDGDLASLPFSDNY